MSTLILSCIHICQANSFTYWASCVLAILHNFGRMGLVKVYGDNIWLYLNWQEPVSPLYCHCPIFIPLLLSQITDHFGQCLLVSSNVLLSAWVIIGWFLASGLNFSLFLESHHCVQCPPLPVFHFIFLFLFLGTVIKPMLQLGCTGIWRQ